MKTPGVGKQFLAGAATYDERYFNLDATVRNLQAALARAGASELEPELVLDIGSGSGSTVFAAAQLFPQARIIASDLSPDMVEIMLTRAETLGLLERIWVMVANSTKIKPFSAQFDLIVGSSMLHHLDDPFATLETMLVGLKPRGLALFYEPFQAGNVVLRQCLGEIIRRLPQHSELDLRIGEFLKVCVIGLDLMFDDSRSDPILSDLDDKWLFRRSQFIHFAERCGLSPPIITCTNPPVRTWETKLTALLYAGLGVTEPLPDWIVEILRSSDHNISEELRQELIMEGEIIFRGSAWMKECCVAPDPLGVGHSRQNDESSTL